jgi:hypothetical protein
MPGLDILFGGITGLLGNVLTGWMNLKTMKLKNEHEQKMIALETNAMKIEAQMNIAVTRAEIEGAVELADSAAYMESIKAGNKSMFSEQWIDRLFSVEGWVKWLATPAAILLALGFGFVDWLRGFMRPALTMYLTGMTTVITWMAWEILQKHGLSTMSTIEATGIFNQTVSIVVYLTVSCVTWWFGDRRMAKFITEMNNKSKGDK